MLTCILNTFATFNGIFIDTFTHSFLFVFKMLAVSGLNIAVVTVRTER